MRLRFPLTPFLVIVFLIRAAVAQSPNGTISGLILDPSGRAIPAAEVLIVNDATGVRYPGATNGEGIYAVRNLPPGPYRLQVSKIGFKTLIKPEVVLNVQDALAINFTLPVGAASETVTVEGGAPLVNSQSAAVSTVIDRKFVENLPLNGRSFNTLLQLTPGIVIAPSNTFAPGQFSVAGQRTDANNFTVDGVSANFGVVATTPQVRQSGSGSAQAFSAIGSTSSLVSVEGLQEFRVETSSFAPEFGKSPGGQVSLTTRSGTNDLHGGLYEFFRNDVFDANDWFANAAGKGRAPERHNDFGIYLGGPIRRDRTFLFVSYEGARLRLPQATIVQVPSAYARTYAATNVPAVAPFLDAYPRPDDSTEVPGVYASQFTGVWSNSARLDAGSVRIDHTFGPRLSVFGRYSDAPSEVTGRVQNLSTLNPVIVNTRTTTVGLSALVNNQLTNTFRINYSTQHAGSRDVTDSFGGAIPPPSTLLLGPLSEKDNLTALFLFDSSSFLAGRIADNGTKQINISDDLSLAVRTHQMKYGVDYRAIDLDAEPFQHAVYFEALSIQNLLSSNGQVFMVTGSSAPARVRSRSLSLYAQDSWKVAPRLTLTYGLRWELSPAPLALGTTTLASWENVDQPSRIKLAPSGTSLWKTTHTNIAPRIGVAYAITEASDLVARAAAGVFYDVGTGSSVVGYFPNMANVFTPAVQIPLADPTPYLPTLSPQPPYPDGSYGFSPKLRLPRSYQWNVAVEKSFKGRQAVSMTYVGQAGRDLLRQEALYQPNSNFSGSFLLTENQARSDYHSLQVQYRRPVSDHVQALLNYSYSHSLDNASNDVVAGLSKVVISNASDRGSSDFDVRHSFSAAISWAVPSFKGPLGVLTRDWSVESVIVARSGFPFNLFVFGKSPDLNGHALTRPDRIGGQPLWISSSSAPGGKIVNPNAFSIPGEVRQGSESRNDIPGFGLAQVDLSASRRFRVTQRVNLEFRVDAFNLLNHPNFANPDGFFFGPDDTSELQSPSMLNRGLGGLNPLFQEGGPRSLQLSLKLKF
jgi:hypothetical protein